MVLFGWPCLPLKRKVFCDSPDSHLISNSEDRPLLRIPKSFQQLKELNGLLKKYRDIYPYRILVSYVTTYLLCVTLTAAHLILIAFVVVLACRHFPCQVPCIFPSLEVLCGGFLELFR